MSPQHYLLHSKRHCLQKKSCFVYVLEDLCLGEHPHKFLSYQSLLKIVVANGSWTWGMQWWQCSQRKITVCSDGKLLKNSFSPLRCQKWHPSFDWPSYRRTTLAPSPVAIHQSWWRPFLYENLWLRLCYCQHQICAIRDKPLICIQSRSGTNM